mmetsp:Transcript_43563/g.79327  ORF Transcript_43563/g.79327 Transcript_43563/m.79327 type:complete len:267 (+) Transcript_43563:255-1055(+)
MFPWSAVVDDGLAKDSIAPVYVQRVAGAMAGKLDRLMFGLQSTPERLPTLLHMARQSSNNRIERSRSRSAGRVRRQQSDEQAPTDGLATDIEQLHVAVSSPVGLFPDPTDAALVLQRWWRKRREAGRCEFLQVVEELRIFRQCASVGIQRLWRGFEARRQCKLLREQIRARASRDVQDDGYVSAGPAAPNAARARGVVRFSDPKPAVKTLQFWWRQRMALKKNEFELLVQELMLLRECAALDIQRVWRMKLRRSAACRNPVKDPAE